MRKRSHCIEALLKMKGNHSPRSTSGSPDLNNTIVLAIFASLAHVLASREVAFHLMSHEIGMSWVSGD